jgi:hypothetical protein
MLFPGQPYTRCRTDERQSTTQGSWSYNWTTYSGTPSDPWHISSIVPHNSSGPLDWLDREMWDVVTPRFNKEVSQGHIINNPMELQYTLYQRSVGTYSAGNYP